MLKWSWTSHINAACPRCFPRLCAPAGNGGIRHGPTSFFILPGRLPIVVQNSPAVAAAFSRMLAWGYAEGFPLHKGVPHACIPDTTLLSLVGRRRSAILGRLRFLRFKASVGKVLADPRKRAKAAS